MNTIANQQPWRSEAFAEDLFGDGFATPPETTPVERLHTALFFAVPVLVGLLGGLAAFWNTVG